jgi:hypothetical protein
MVYEEENLEPKPIRLSGKRTIDFLNELFIYLFFLIFK